jgi:hypothetical protein
MHGDNNGKPLVTPHEMRFHVAKALSRGYRGSENHNPTPKEVASYTGLYSDETCALMFSVIGTEYEKVTADLAIADFEDEIVAAFVRFSPGHDEEGYRLFHHYLRALSAYRRGIANPSPYHWTLTKLVTAATRYQQSTGRTNLPGATSEEQLVVDFARARPEMAAILRERLAAKHPVQETIDQLTNAPSPAIAEGML